MTARIIKPKSKVLVVGPIYNHISKLNKLLQLSQLYDFIIINGNILYPADETIDDRIGSLSKIIDKGKFIYVNGDLDYQLIKNINYQKWLECNPNVVFIQYKQNTYIVTCGGVSPEMNRDTIYSSLETTFVSNIGNINWHDSYGGGYGYIISNNPLTNNPPMFYNFSVQIGNKFCGEKTATYAQEIDEYSLKDTILL